MPCDWFTTLFAWVNACPPFLSVEGVGKHLGRIKRHFVDTDVQLGNYELREVNRFGVALKVSRTARGVPLLEDLPGVGLLLRPLPQADSSLQENIISPSQRSFRPCSISSACAGREP